MLFRSQRQRKRFTDQTPRLQAQTPQQRRANAKFVKDQDARRGKSDADRQARAKEVQKSPISPIWLSEFWLSLFAPTRGIGLPSKDDTLLTVCPLISSPPRFRGLWRHLLRGPAAHLLAIKGPLVGRRSIHERSSLCRGIEKKQEGGKEGKSNSCLPGALVSSRGKGDRKSVV